MKKLLFSILWIISIVGIFTINAAQYSTEMVDAYNRAYQNWIIWESSIDDANLYDALPNPVMRAILLNFASYLWLDSDSVAESFGDLFIDEGSYANRANFGTALSRILRWDNYEWWNPYYKNHLEALKTAGIITQIENPEDVTEIKWYVLTILMKIADDYNKTDCNDPVVVLACSDRESDTYESCPDICRPNGILNNNLTKTVEFKSNEVSKKVVFNGTYTVLKDNTVNYYSVETLYDESKGNNYIEERCKKNNTEMVFYLYIDWEMIGSSRLLNTCNLWQWAGFGRRINEITFKKWQSKNIKVEVEIRGSVQEDDIYNFTLSLKNVDKDTHDLFKEDDKYTNFAPIKIIHNDEEIDCNEPLVVLACEKDTETCPINCRTYSGDSKKCEWMDSAKVSHTIDNDIITLKWNAIEWDNVEILIYDPQKEVYKTLWTVGMSNRTFTYKVKRTGEQNFLLNNWCNEYNYKINIKTIEEQEDTSDFWTISITNPNNPSEKITIMDRNLWATSNDIKNPNSYGYYYQRWNNYGFPWDGTIKTTTSKATRNDKYNNKWFYNNKFIKQSVYWEDEDDYIFHDWLWWWINDSNENNRWAYSDNHGDRQWPCPEWWHVPSAWEWWLLVKYYRDTYAKNTKLYEGDSSAASIWGDWLYYFSDEDTRLKFQQYFKIPLAGSMSWSNGSVEHRGGFGNYRSSSSIKDSSNTISFTLRNADVWKDNWYWIRTEWESIRCFKNKETSKSTNQEIINKEDTKEDIKQNDIPTSIEPNYNNWNPSETLNNWYTKEMNDAYEYAHNNGITTTSNIEKAKMNSPLTRIAMAKMLSYYAINILEQKPNTSKTIIFNDVSEKQNSDYNNAVTLAYQLWIMWQNMKNNNFRPNDEVTRAEFATALSRMLYNIEDGKWKIKYYEPHIIKLYNEWVLSNTNPQMKEKRWYVMIMLMRTKE